ncbi:Microspherule protein 1-like protein, partial [Drosera capensis]
MGAMAAVTTPWTPADDLVLKNAVEAGASLESLAKGAVHFSRRYSIEELRQRWHSLLYHPVISADAASQMLEFEHNGPLKSLSVSNAKETRRGNEKRKFDSVRACYYAKRKRIWNEPLDPGAVDFILPPGDSNVNRGYISNKEFKARGFENTYSDTLHDVFPKGVEEQCPPYRVRRISDDLTRGHQNKVRDILMDESCRLGQTPQDLGDRSTFNENCARVGHMESSKELSAHDSEAIENPDISNNISQGFEQNGVYFNSSTGADCDGSYAFLQCSSPLALASDWRTIESMTVQEFSRDFGPIEGVAFNPHEGYGRMKTDFAADFSNALLDLAGVEDMLFAWDDGKDAIDNVDISGLGSLLLNSPDDANVDGNLNSQLPNVADARASVGPDLHVDIPVGSCAGNLDNDLNDRM